MWDVRSGLAAAPYDGLPELLSVSRVPPAVIRDPPFISQVDSYVPFLE
jgi:hypothetical protein